LRVKPWRNEEANGEAKRANKREAGKNNNYLRAIVVRNRAALGDKEMCR